MLKQLDVVATEHPNVTLWHSQVRGKLQLATKDFVEKRVVFAHDKAVYSFFSSNSALTDAQLFAPLDGVERGETYYGATKISRNSA